jgi:hypothetical protein
MDLSSADWRKSTHSGGNGGGCVEVATWRKSTYSGGNGGACVEVGTWRKSTHSTANGGQCVEVAHAARVVMVRDTTNRAAGALTFPATAWQSLLAEVRASR